MTEPDDKIRKLRAQREEKLEEAEELRRQIFAEVQLALPEGEEPPRGLITRIVNATGWTRAYVADIRKGRVTPS